MKHMDAADQTPNDDNVLTEKPRKGATGRGLKRVRGPKKPSKYAVVLHNDDFTPMDFVVYVLQEIFNHPFERAERIMLSVHNEGMCVAGVYRFEIAELQAFEQMKPEKIDYLLLDREANMKWSGSWPW